VVVKKSVWLLLDDVGILFHVLNCQNVEIMSFLFLFVL
jgi:hypothetical protein